MAKRIHISGAAYHITTNPKFRSPFFEEDIFCEILYDVIFHCMTIKPFNLISSKINPDHIHLTIQPIGNFNISQIMHNIKRVSSDHINQILFAAYDESSFHDLNWTDSLEVLAKLFFRKNNFDQLIRTYDQLISTIEYHEKQSEHHDLKENKFLYINKNIPNDIVFIGNKK